MPPMRRIFFTRVEGCIVANVHRLLHFVNSHSEHLVLIGLLPPLVVHTRIAHLAIRDDLMSAFTGQNKSPLQASVVIDIGVNRCLSNDERSQVLVSYECP